MPKTTLRLFSEGRNRRVPDEPDLVVIRGRLNGRVIREEIDWTPRRLVWNAKYDRHRITTEIPEFRRTSSEFTVEPDGPRDIVVPVRSRITTLPEVDDLSDEQQRLLASRRRGFKQDQGTAHPTHSRFGYTKSFRQKRGKPKLQVTLSEDNMGADIDLDVGSFHRSAPHDVYKKLVKAYPDVAPVYVVK